VATIIRFEHQIREFPIRYRHRALHLHHQLWGVVHQRKEGRQAVKLPAHDVLQKGSQKYALPRRVIFINGDA
jgi:hypothetical protein